jgi:long-chain acyl-CoA synthetase
MASSGNRKAARTRMNLAQTLETVAGYAADRPALSWDGGCLSYGQFAGLVRRIAGGLSQRHALRANDRVALAMPNSWEFLPLLYGIWHAGLTAVPMNSKLHPREMAWILEHAEAKLVIASPDIAEALSRPDLAAALPNMLVTGSPDHDRLLKTAALDLVRSPPDQEAWLFYTSGTTGRPKGAVLTHRNLLFSCHCYYADIDALGPEDAILHAAPLTHGSGLYALAHLARGSNNVVVAGAFEPEQVFRTLAGLGNVSMFAAPTMVSRLINHPRAGGADTRGLKTLIYGGAPMYVSDLKRAIALFGAKLYQLYGQGESPMTITGLDQRRHAEHQHPRFEQRLASAGVARTGVAVRVVDENGAGLPPGTVGEIITSSDCVMRGYWRDPAATARTLRQGWLWTGDLGALDEDGFLTILDRSKDMIISGGSNIYPREIEEVLLGHAGVLEAAVVGQPHPDWGEEVIAFVVKRPGAELTAQSLDQLCLDNIARFKRPRGYRFVASLPKNNYGKILKTELRRMLTSEQT